MNNVRKIEYATVSSTSDDQWRPFPAMPGMSTITFEDAEDDHGWKRKWKVETVLRRIYPEIRGHMLLKVWTESGKVIAVGSPERPVRMTIRGENPVKASCEWSQPLL